MPHRLRVLLVENNPADARQLVADLEAGGYEAEVRCVDTLAAVRQALQEPGWELVIAAYALAGCSGLEVLTEVQSAGCDTPVILVSGVVEEEVAADALVRGAHDFVRKDRRARFLPAVARELEAVRLRRLKRQQDELAAAILAGVMHSVAVVDQDGHILAVNSAWRAFAAANGLPDQQWEGVDYLGVCDAAQGPEAATAAEFAAALRDVLAGRRAGGEFEYECDSPDERRWFVARISPLPGDRPRRAMIVHENTTARRLLDEERQTVVELLRLLNAGTDLHELIAAVTQYLQQWSGCEAVGVRLRQGDDYPYFETRGFDPEFVRLEYSLCSRGPDGQAQFDEDGRPLLDCMCGNIIGGQFDASQPNFTARGSFWTNCVSDLVASTTPADLPARTRGRCSGAGYESVALIPLHAGGETLGLLQLNDRRRDRFTVARIGLLERLADSIAIALTQRQAAAALRESEALFATLFRDAPTCTALTRLRDGRFINVNERFVELYGYRRHEILGRTSLEVPMWADLADRQRMFELVRQTGHARGFEADALTKSGQIRRILVFAQRVTVAGEACIVGQFLDITAGRQAQEELRQSEERFRAITAHTPDHILMQDRELRYTFVLNPQVGLTMAEMLGHTDEEFLGPQDAAKLTAIKRAVLETGEPVHLETSVANKSGDDEYFEGDFVPQRNSAGQVDGLIGYFRNITERRRAEEALAASQHFVEQILGATPNLISVYDLRERRNVFANRSVFEILGYTADELQQLGSDLLPVLLHPDDAASVADYHARCACAPAGQVSELEFRMKHRSGDWRWLRTRDIAFARGPDDTATQVLGLTEDITARRQANEQLRWDLAVQAALAALYQPLIAESTTLDTMAQEVLCHALSLTESRLGYAALVDPVTCAIGGLTLSPDLAAAWGVADQQESSLVSQYAANRRQLLLAAFGSAEPICRNSAVDAGRVAGLDPAETGFARLLAVPVLLAGEVVAQIVVFNGAHDNGPREIAALTRVAEFFALAIQRQRHRARLQRSEELYQSLVENLPLKVFRKDAEGRFVFANQRFCELLGQPLDVVLGRSDADFLPAELAARYRENDLAVMAAGTTYTAVHHHDLPGHPPVVLDVTKVPIRDAAGAVVGVQGILIDITARSTLEEQFRHAQRLQSIGRLAGGVAHDLNNLLTPILGYSDFLAAGFEPDDERADDVAQIRLAAERARDLTRQLLAFGRKQVLELAPLDLRDVVRDFRQLLRRTLREDIAIDLPPAEPCVVLADVGQIQQVLMNLAVNAQDAMPGGGTLTIAVSRTAADQVELLVADTGGGIDATILPHLFEPFFTTKRKGEGTGLGLATVHGIVAQHGGTITVDSTPGGGAAFRILLPRVSGEPVISLLPAPDQPLDLRGQETIMVVDDDSGVHELARRVLSGFGYHVLAATSGESCLVQLATYTGPLDLLVTDVVMPGMTGRELGERLTAQRPGLPVLYITGHDDNVVARHGLLEPGVALLAKPFTPEELGQRVRQALDAGR